MDDDVVQSWAIAPELQVAMRLRHLHRALGAGDLQEAVIEAEELLDEAPAHPDALLALGEALLGLGDAEGAADALEHHLQVAPTQNPEALAKLALARLDLCDLVGAAEVAREATRLAPGSAAAHFYLALALERQPGRATEAVSEFLAAYQLDPVMWPLPIDLTRQDWERALGVALHQVAEPFQRLWSGVPIHLEEAPDLDDLRAADPPISITVAGLYVGEPPEIDADTPLTLAGLEGMGQPAALRLFTTNLRRVGSFEHLVDRIADVLESEGLNWFGLGPDELGALLGSG